jgi:hypothetical protein
MKRGLLIILPCVAYAVAMSLPAELPAQQAVATPPVEEESPAEAALPTEAISLTTTPAQPIQGDPVLITVRGLSSTTTIRSLRFKSEEVPPYVEGGKVHGLVAIDLRMTPGAYPLTLTLTDGRVIQQNVVVGKKVIASAPLGIPETLGGNTATATETLVNSLVDEAKIINAIKSSDERLWSSFAYPLAPPITITDVYGYSRDTNGTSLAHKGTDFRAAVDTPVSAIADGIVSYTGYLRDYGNVIAVDHGTKILSIYMHLSRIEVAAGQAVRKGEEIARSGDTGYVLGPHLHLTIRIDNISIDPMKFLALFGVQ